MAGGYVADELGPEQRQALQHATDAYGRVQLFGPPPVTDAADVLLHQLGDVHAGGGQVFARLTESWAACRTDLRI